MSYGYPGQGYGPSGHHGGGGGGWGQPPPPPGGGYGQYPPPGGPPPPPGPDGYGYYPPPGPPPPHHHQQPEYAPPPGPPPRHQEYNPPPGPPPQRRYDEYSAPPGPPPTHHHQEAYAQPHYAPPSRPPPQGYDSYGYPTQQQSFGGGGGGGYNRGEAPPPPPSVPQQFGHGAPDQYQFQYSQCTGKRKALLIGINYFGQQGELRGCINDVKNVSNFLIERYNYKPEDMVKLTDDASNPIMHPTRENILRACQWLVKDAQPNDSLFFHYSGHGGQTEDLDGDEDDGFDEVIYPVDYKQTSHIVDDELHNIMVKPLVAGVRLTAIFDSCHSGSCLDLPYIYSTKGVLKEPNLAKEAGMGLLQAVAAYAQGDISSVGSTLMGLAKTAFRGDGAYKKTVQTKTSPADVIMWSGSKDDQTSADATIASQATGAMSWAFITAIKQNPQQSYVQLLNSIRDVLATKYEQKPQLSSSHPLDTNLLFVM